VPCGVTASLNWARLFPKLRPGRLQPMRSDTALSEVSFNEGKKPIEVFIDRVSSSAAAEKSQKSTLYAEEPSARARRHEPTASRKVSCPALHLAPVGSAPDCRRTHREC